MEIIDRMPSLRPADAAQRIGVVRVACGAAGADQAGRMRHPDAPRYAIKRDQTLKDAEQVFTRHELPIPLVREHRLFLRHDAFLPITHEHFGLADVLHVDSRLFGGA